MKIYENPEYQETDTIYSNFDHMLDENIAKKITEKKLYASHYASHAAWNFCGYIYFDKESKLFIEEIMQYHSLVEIMKNEDINELISEANEKYGSA